MKILLIFILFLGLFNSCDSTDPIDNNSEPVAKYNPLKIGNKWEYSYKTEAENAIIEKIIKNNITHEDGSNIWGYTEAVKVNNPDPNEPIDGYNTFKTEGLYFYSSDKDTIIPGTNILCRKQLILKAPVSIGTQWQTNDGASCRIVTIGNCNVSGTIYPNTALVITETNQGTNQGIDSSWYSLNVGLVKRVLNSGIGSQYPSTTRWELLSYTLL